jgi:hypothetical protein
LHSKQYCQKKVNGTKETKLESKNVVIDSLLLDAIEEDTNAKKQ